MTFDLSLGEFSALTAKALRGAGYPWGLATDGAHTARMLAQAGLPAADCVVRLLDHIATRSGIQQATSTPGMHVSPHVLCPLSLGAALADLGHGALAQAADLLASQSVLQPILIAPVLRRSSIKWAAGRADIDGDQIHLIGELPRCATTITIEPFYGDLAPRSAGLTRAAIDAAAYDTLLSWAARTYAPATAASRSGAGSDTTDND